jgi:DNA-binding IclR family transcriptional regulator
MIKSSKSKSSTADRLLKILYLFGENHVSWTVEEASEQLGLSGSTTYRYFKSLAEAGVISSFGSGRYVMGPAIVQFDRLMRLHDPLIISAKPIMMKLANQAKFKGIFLLCRAYRQHVLCVHQEPSESAKENVDNSISYERGQLMPLHRGASSKIILANCDSRFSKNYYEDNSDDFSRVGLGTKWPEVRTTLRKIRKNGFCVTTGEVNKNVSGIATPIFYEPNSIAGSLSVALFEWDGVGMDGIVSSLLDSADRITTSLRMRIGEFGLPYTVSAP